MSDDTQLPDGVDESEREPFDIWVHNGNDGDDADGFRDAYVGEWHDVSDYVEELVRDVNDIPEWVEYYIDWVAMARDWEINGDIWTERSLNGVYVFRNY